MEAIHSATSGSGRERSEALGGVPSAVAFTMGDFNSVPDSALYRCSFNSLLLPRLRSPRPLLDGLPPKVVVPLPQPTK